MEMPFLNFLQSTGRLSADEVERISRWAASNREPIGMIAVAHGLITGEQIDEVLDHQRRSGSKFGQIGVELGLLTEKQVQTLLEIQHHRTVMAVLEAMALSESLPLIEGLRAQSEFITTRPDQALTGFEASAA